MKLTFSQHNDLKECLQETLVLNQKMNDTLVDIIKSANENKIIRTDRQVVKGFDKGELKVLFTPAIYAYVYNQNLEQYTEEKVSAVAVFEDKTIGILLCGDVVFGEEVTDDILLESSDWHTLDNGTLLGNFTTLYNICENIEDYL
jgi:hypothetical protein